MRDKTEITKLTICYSDQKFKISYLSLEYLQFTGTVLTIKMFKKWICIIVINTISGIRIYRVFSEVEVRGNQMEKEDIYSLKYKANRLFSTFRHRLFVFPLPYSDNLLIWKTNPNSWINNYLGLVKKKIFSVCIVVWVAFLIDSQWWYSAWKVFVSRWVHEM